MAPPSRARAVVKFAYQLGSTRLRGRTGPIVYLGLTLSGLRLARLLVARRSQRVLITDLQPGDGIAIRALRPGDN